MFGTKNLFIVTAKRYRLTGDITSLRISLENIILKYGAIKKRFRVPEGRSPLCFSLLDDVKN